MRKQGSRQGPHSARLDRCSVPGLGWEPQSGSAGTWGHSRALTAPRSDPPGSPSAAHLGLQSPYFLPLCPCPLPPLSFELKENPVRYFMTLFYRWGT